MYKELEKVINFFDGEAITFEVLGSGFDKWQVFTCERLGLGYRKTIGEIDFDKLLQRYLQACYSLFGMYYVRTPEFILIQPVLKSFCIRTDNKTSEEVLYKLHNKVVQETGVTTIKNLI